MKRIMIIRTPKRRKFDELVMQAKNGNAKPLRNYLIKTDRLSPDERRSIAAMIHNKYQHGEPGNPYGNRNPKFDPNLHTAARKARVLKDGGMLEHDAIEVVRKEHAIPEDAFDALYYLVKHPGRIK